MTFDTEFGSSGMNKPKMEDGAVNADSAPHATPRPRRRPGGTRPVRTALHMRDTIARERLPSAPRPQAIDLKGEYPPNVKVVLMMQPQPSHVSDDHVDGGGMRLGGHCRLEPVDGQ